MKLGPVTKIDKRNPTASKKKRKKKNDDDVVLVNYESIAIFPNFG